ncbi:hypothetical protein EMCRGX_G027680 [Ephydatia muelleri]
MSDKKIRKNLNLPIAACHHQMQPLPPRFDARVALLWDDASLKAHKDEVDASLDPVSHVPSPKSQKGLDKWSVSPAELEVAGQVAIETAVRVEDAPELSKSDVEVYVNKAFGLIPEAARTKLWQTAREKQKHLSLHCKVVSAEGLPAMDANGKSDPYCIMGIVPKKYQEMKKYNLHDLEDKEVGELQTTSVKPETLTPEWNEQFEFHIDDPNDKLLVVECWDSDKVRVDVSKIKGVRGVCHFIKDLFGDDDFIGRLFQPLKNISYRGEKVVFELFSYSANKKRGKITLHLAICRQGDGTITPEQGLKNYRDLLKAIVTQESEEATKQKGQNGAAGMWDTRLSPAAEALLRLNASLGGIDESQQAAVRLSVLLEYHQAFTLPQGILLSLLETVAKYGQPQTAGTSPEGGGPSDLMAGLFRNLRELLDQSLEVLSNHLVTIDPASSGGLETLKSHLLSVKKLYSYEAFVASLPDDRKSMKDQIKKSIEASVSKWYSLLIESKMQPGLNEQLANQLTQIKDICHNCRVLCQTAQQVVAPQFEQLLYSTYLADFYQSLDKLLPALVVAKMDFPFNESEKQGQDALSIAFEIYLIFHDLSKDVRKLNGTYELLTYHKWFRNLVPCWLKVALIRCKERIAEAISIDKVETIADNVPFSSSAVDSLVFIQQVVAFWNDLDWPSPEDYYAFMITLIKYITEAALYYTDEVYKTISDHTLVDKETGKFNVTVQLCVILNNMQHIRDKFSPPQGSKEKGMMEELKLESFFAQLDAKRNGTGEQAKSLVKDIVESAAEDIQHKLLVVTTALGQQFIPTIRTFIFEMLKTSDEASANNVLKQLEQYLGDNLMTLSSNLLYIVFRTLLHQMWIAVILAVESFVPIVPKKKSSRHVLQILHAALLNLRDFFSADGDGLTGTELESDQYKNLVKELQLMCLSTRELVLRCCADLAEQQAKVVGSPEHKYGELTLSVGYLIEREVIEVAVVKGDNLSPTDKNGFSDPYVEIALLPSSHKKLKTHVINHTLNPVFNEELLLPILQDETKESAILVLAVYDYEIVGKNDFMGICVIPWKDIPQISNTASLLNESAAERRNLALPLFHIEDSKALQELTQRHHFSHDHEATAFTHLLKNNYRPRGEHGLLARIGLVAPHLRS